MSKVGDEILEHKVAKEQFSAKFKQAANTAHKKRMREHNLEVKRKVKFNSD